MLEIRQAGAADVEAICAFDQVAQEDLRRREFVERSVASGACVVAVDGGVIGYAALDYSFYDNGFVSMLYVRPDRRRNGAGRALMEHLESVCRTQKLFTSTNLSNLPMQSLLARLGYSLSGVIENLDEGDAELVYFKSLGSPVHGIAHALVAKS